MSPIASIARKRRLTLRSVAAGAIAAVLAAGLIAPLFNVNRLRGQIQSALEAALNRRVEIDAVHLNLFTGPGFTLDGVNIADRPEYGIEPFAHVESLKARIRLASLWTGRLAFSRLTLVDPTVNFVKLDKGPWNVQPILTRAAGQGPREELPDIQIDSGRLNFKFGAVKSVFYLGSADLELYPDEHGDLVINFSGEPVRTDHAAQDLGRLVARGVLHSGDGGELDMSVQLERTAISELARLFDVQNGAVQGYVASNIKLDGPLRHIGISGDLRIDDIHRWDLMPNKSAAWVLNYQGTLDLRAQKLEIEAGAAGASPSPVTGKLVASDYLTSPQWETSLSFVDVPAAGLLETARHIGIPLPTNATLEGNMNGGIAYSKAEGVRGRLVLDRASLRFAQGGAAETEDAAFELNGGEIRFGPARVILDNGSAAQVSALYSLNTRALSFGVSTDRMAIAQTKTLAAGFSGAEPLPLLEDCNKGFWKGALEFERDNDGSGEWKGQFEIANTQIEAPGLTQPVKISSAAVRAGSGAVQISRLRARLGKIAIEGDYRLTAGEDPDRFHLTASELDLAELEQLFLPTLRRRQGFFARALRLQPAAAPGWLADRDAEGNIAIEHLEAGTADLGALHSQVIWDGAKVRFPDLTASLDDTALSGSLLVNLANPLPRYSFRGRLQNADYRNGKLDVDGTLETSGAGPALLVNAKSEGAFSGTAIQLSPGAEIDGITGVYRLSMGRTGPRLALPSVQVTQGQDLLRGQGASRPDGRVVLELASGDRQVRLSGALLPVAPDTAP